MKNLLLILTLGMSALTAQAATETTVYMAGDSGEDLLKVDSDHGTLPGLSNPTGNGGLPQFSLNTLRTKDDNSYALLFNTKGQVHFKLDEAVYFNSVSVGKKHPTSFTIDFGSGGSITTAREFNIGKYKVDNEMCTPSLKLTAGFSPLKFAEIAIGHYLGGQKEMMRSRTLLEAKSNFGFWNVYESYKAGDMTFTSPGLDAIGMSNAGVVASPKAIKVGQYGLVYTEVSGKLIHKHSESIELVVKTHEPIIDARIIMALAALLLMALIIAILASIGNRR